MSPSSFEMIQSRIKFGTIWRLQSQFYAFKWILESFMCHHEHHPQLNIKLWHHTVEK